MKKNKLMLLDCTLRDGGYINEWCWGFDVSREIINALVKSGVDMIEVGFLRNVKEYDPDKTICNKIDELNKLLPKEKGNSSFCCMIMTNNYDIDKLDEYSGEGIDLIRVTAHDYDLNEGFLYARIIKEKGYRVSLNPINIMGYSDEELIQMVKNVNRLMPYQFSIVDTFGCMKRRDLDRVVSILDNNLDMSIRLALHLHENMSQSVCLAQRFIDMHLKRHITIDASLMGIGRNPGNLPMELIADYVNDYEGKAYDLDYMLDSIQDYILPYKGDCRWGYNPTFFLSAKHNLHRNYAEYYLHKGDLSNRDINHILSRFNDEHKSVFDCDYADSMYNDYMDHRIDDSNDRQALIDNLSGQKILLVAPGKSLITYMDTITEYIMENNPVIIGVNFVPDSIKADYVFFSNNRRYEMISDVQSTIIVTSNLGYGKADYVIDYNSLSGAFDRGCNSLIMVLKLLKDVGVSSVSLAGADGYSGNDDDYFTDVIKSRVKRSELFNHSVTEAIRRIGMQVMFVTPSAYEE